MAHGLFRFCSHSCMPHAATAPKAGLRDTYCAKLHRRAQAPLRRRDKAPAPAPPAKPVANGEAAPAPAPAPRKERSSLDDYVMVRLKRRERFKWRSIALFCLVQEQGIFIRVPGHQMLAPGQATRTCSCIRPQQRQLGSARKKPYKAACTHAAGAGGGAPGEPAGAVGEGAGGGAAAHAHRRQPRRARQHRALQARREYAAAG